MLKMNPEYRIFLPYLEDSELYNFNFPPFIDTCNEIQNISTSELLLIENIYKFNRDNIKHTVNTNKKNVPITSSDVIFHKHGICCAKANLFSAMLRYFKIPVGFCYQKIKSNNQYSFDLHGLNAVYLSEYDKWIRMDVGGVDIEKESVFSFDEEQISYKVDPRLGEIDHKTIFAKPILTVIEVMKKSKNTEELWTNWNLTLNAVFIENNYS